MKQDLFYFVLFGLVSTANGATLEKIYITNNNIKIVTYKSIKPKEGGTNGTLVPCEVLP